MKNIVLSDVNWHSVAITFHQSVCGRFYGHRLKPGNAKIEIDYKTNTITITDACVSCGKPFICSFRWDMATRRKRKRSRR